MIKPNISCKDMLKKIKEIEQGDKKATLIVSMLYSHNYGDLQNQDPFKSYTDKYTHKTGKNWDLEYSYSGEGGKTKHIVDSIVSGYDFIYNGEFSADRSWLVIACFKLTVGNVNYVAMCDLYSVLDETWEDFSFDRNMNKIIQSYNKSRMPRTPVVEKYDGKIPPQLRGHKTVHKSGLCQLENSVRKMW